MSRGQGLPRIFDVLMGAAVLIVLAPVMCACALAVALSSRGPVFFRQTRVGRVGRPFLLYKFRTMRVSNQGPQITAEDDRRITAVGKVLRKTKLDELPEFWNILRGDMAIAGPRPEVPRYVDLNDVRWRKVLEARPGLTDPVTVILRNEQALLASVPGDRERYYIDVLLPWKLEGYLNYLVQRTWWTDLWILWMTALAIALPQSAQSTDLPKP